MDRQKTVVKTSAIGIITNLLLVAFKATIGILANSIAIILDAVNNLSDVLSSVVTIIGIKLSSKEPDKEHPYGHGRIEYFSSLIIGVLILYIGCVSFKESFDKILSPAEVNYSIATIIIVIVAIITKFFLSKYFIKVGNSINSQSLVASGKDAFNDSILSCTTLIGIFSFMMFKLNIEGYLGILISLIILKAGYETLKETINDIIGERVDKELTTKLKEFVLNSNKEIQGVYDLSLHNYGPNKMVGSLHIQVRDDLTAEEIHYLTRDIEYHVFKEFGIFLTIGIYAANNSGLFGEIQKDISNIIKDYKEILQFHGFFVDKTKKIVYFDLIIDFECKDKKGLRDEIIDKIKEKHPEYEYYVVIDSDLTD